MVGGISDQRALEFVLKFRNEANAAFQALGKDIAGVEKEVVGFAKGTEQATKKLGDIGQVLGIVTAAVGAFVASTATLVKGVSVFGDYEEALTRLSLVMDDGEEGVKGIRDELEAFALQSGKPLVELTLGLENVISSLGDTEEALGFMELAVKGAVAGVTSTEEVFKTVSSTIKSYGDTNLEAGQKVVDLAFQAQQLGDVRFAELVPAIQLVSGASAQMGVSLEELFGIMATLGNVTGSVTQVATGLRQGLLSLERPTARMKKVFDDLGVSTGRELIQLKGGLLPAFLAVTQSANSLGFNLASVVTGVEALTTITPLLTTQSQKAKENIAGMGDAAGATNLAYERMAKNLNVQLSRVSRVFELFLADVGEALAPALKEMANVIVEASTAFEELDESTQKFIATGFALSALLIGLVPLFKALKLAAKAFGFGAVAVEVGAAAAATSRFMTVLALLGKLKGPLIIGGVVVGVIELLNTLMGRYDDAVSETQNFIDKTKEAFLDAKIELPTGFLDQVVKVEGPLAAIKLLRDKQDQLIADLQKAGVKGVESLREIAKLDPAEEVAQALVSEDRSGFSKKVLAEASRLEQGLDKVKRSLDFGLVTTDAERKLKGFVSEFETTVTQLSGLFETLGNAASEGLDQQQRDLESSVSGAQLQQQQAVAGLRQFGADSLELLESVASLDPESELGKAVAGIGLDTASEETLAKAVQLRIGLQQLKQDLESGFSVTAADEDIRKLQARFLEATDAVFGFQRQLFEVKAPTVTSSEESDPKPKKDKKGKSDREKFLEGIREETKELEFQLTILDKEVEVQKELLDAFKLRQKAEKAGLSENNQEVERLLQLRKQATEEEDKNDQRKAAREIVLNLENEIEVTRAAIDSSRDLALVRKLEAETTKLSAEERDKLRVKVEQLTESLFKEQQARSVRTEIDATRSSLEAEALALNLTRKEREQLLPILELEARLRRANVSDEGISADLEKLRGELQAANVARLEAQKDIGLGVRNAFNEIEADALNLAGKTEDILKGLFDGLSESLVDFVNTGKGGFAELAQDFARQVQVMIIKWLAFQALTLAKNNKSSGILGTVLRTVGSIALGAVTSGAGSGGVSSGITSGTSPGGFTFGAPVGNTNLLFAEGGIALPRRGGVQATLAEAGEPELVLPLSKAKQVGFGGANQTSVSMTTNISIQDGKVSRQAEQQGGDQFGRELSLKLQEAVDTRIQELQRPGNLLNPSQSRR